MGSALLKHTESTMGRMARMSRRTRRSIVRKNLRTEWYVSLHQVSCLSSILTFSHYQDSPAVKPSAGKFSSSPRPVCPTYLSSYLT